MRTAVILHPGMGLVLYGFYKKRSPTEPKLRRAEGQAVGREAGPMDMVRVDQGESAGGRPPSANWLQMGASCSTGLPRAQRAFTAC